jgi:hypothetical protein
MEKEKFGVAVDEKTVQEVDELVAESADLGAATPRSSKLSSQHSFNPSQTTLSE